MGKGYRPEKRAYQPEQPDELPSGPAPEPPPGTRTGKSEPDDQLLHEIGKAVVERVDEEGFLPKRDKQYVWTCLLCENHRTKGHTDDCPLTPEAEAEITAGVEPAHADEPEGDEMIPNENEPAPIGEKEPPSEGPLDRGPYDYVNERADRACEKIAAQDGQVMVELPFGEANALRRLYLRWRDEGDPPTDEEDEDGESSEPTPEKLREWADWFDNPNEAPGLAIAPPRPSTPGMVLRQIADGLERATMRLRDSDGREVDDATES